MSVVAFDPIQFAALFPELAGVSQTQLTFYWQLAGDYVNNTDCGVVPYDPPNCLIRSDALYLTVAHLAKIFGTNGNAAPSGLVGRIANATEGTVTVGTALDLKSQAAQFWLQSPYGFAVWQMLAPYRTAIYTAKIPRNFNPPGLGGPYYGGIRGIY